MHLLFSDKNKENTRHNFFCEMTLVLIGVFKFVHKIRKVLLYRKTNVFFKINLIFFHQLNSAGPYVKWLDLLAQSNFIV